jgi:EAL domain-containing protein (putative c-di-GMP-specific phosphodiesterase class I)
MSIVDRDGVSLRSKRVGAARTLRRRAVRYRVAAEILDRMAGGLSVDPHLLEFEITESLLIRDVEATLRILTGLKGLGIRIAIDDFGTGYTSLATLQRFPLDTIKIDRSFIHGITAGTHRNRRHGIPARPTAAGRCGIDL